MSTTAKNTKYLLIEGTRSFEKLDEIFEQLTKVSRETPSARFKETTSGDTRTFQRVNNNSLDGQSVQQLIASLAESTNRQNIFTIKSRNPMSDSTQTSNLLLVFYDALDMIHYKGRTPEIRANPLRALCDELAAAFRIEHKFSDVYAKFLKSLHPTVRGAKPHVPTPREKYEALLYIETKQETFKSFLTNKMGLTEGIESLATSMAQQAAKYWVVNSGKNYSVRLLENVQQRGNHVHVFPANASSRKTEASPTHTYIRQPDTRILEPDQDEMKNMSKRAEARKKGPDDDSYIKSKIRVKKSAEEIARDEMQKKELAGRLVGQLIGKVDEAFKPVLKGMSVLQLTNVYKATMARTGLDDTQRHFIAEIKAKYDHDLTPNA